MTPVRPTRRGLWMGAGITLAAGLALFVIVGLASSMFPTQESFPLNVQVVPALTEDGALHVGENTVELWPGYWAPVEVRSSTDVDGALHIKLVRGVSPTWNVLHVWLCESPTSGFTAIGRAYDVSDIAGAERVSTPMTHLRGTVRVNHSSRSELSASPLVVDLELDGHCAGSDAKIAYRVVVRDGDMR